MRSEWRQITRLEFAPGFWVTARVHIRNNATGVVHTYESQEVLIDGVEHPETFIWEEGNFSCDCNRAAFWGLVDEETECGEGKFSVNLQNPDTGEFYYKEFQVEKEAGKDEK